mmetsp:Transcript_56509/g.150587  ORF Transcript_56509/g.150587 Transcript_56509/m.150587 type:complete len:301 (-) Transcript_56509:594-1496(-)
MLLGEGRPGHHGPGVVVLDGGVGLACREEIELGVGLHLQRAGDLVGSGIEQGHLHGLHSPLVEGLGQHLPIRLGRLAVPAPRRVEHHKMILVPVHHLGVPGLPHQLLQRPVVLRRGDLGQDAGLRLPRAQGVEELGDRLGVLPHAAGDHPLAHPEGRACGVTRQSLPIREYHVILLLQLLLLPLHVHDVEVEVRHELRGDLPEAVHVVDQTGVEGEVVHDDGLLQHRGEGAHAVVQDPHCWESLRRPLRQLRRVGELVPRDSDHSLLLLAQGRHVPHEEDRLRGPQGAGHVGALGDLPES